jgi:FlaA1/EpsC-like NDP-sugar epimerase
MGQPIRIIDLARAMVQLSGCTVRDENNPDGDIAIEEVGLRPGEKMYEELLLGNNPQPTDHSRIMHAQEARLGWDELALMLAELYEAIDAGDVDRAMAVVCRGVPDYAHPDHSVVAESFSQLRSTGG